MIHRYVLLEIMPGGTIGYEDGSRSTMHSHSTDLLRHAGELVEGGYLLQCIKDPSVQEVWAMPLCNPTLTSPSPSPYQILSTLGNLDEVPVSIYVEYWVRTGKVRLWRRRGGKLRAWDNGEEIVIP